MCKPHRTSNCDFDTGSTTSGFATFTVDLIGVSAAELSFDDRKETEELSNYDHMWIDYDYGSGGENLVSYNASSNQLSWTGHTLSLNNAAGNIVDIRFGFDSVDNNYNNYDGWYLDNVEVTEGASNSPPTASWIHTEDGLTIDTDATFSSDPDGDALAYYWGWGDGSPTDTGLFASHTYDVCPSGTFDITLTVEDEHGATDTDTQTHTLEDYDSDSDGLVDCEETQTYNTDPTDADTDDDGLEDGSELAEWNSLESGAWDTRYNRSAPTGTTNNLLLRDADGDGISDALEFNQPTDVFGSCSDIDGRDECPDPRTRDVYMHVNWMVDPGYTCNFFFTCGDHDHQPSNEDVQRIYDNFADHNSGSSRLDSVNVHIYLDQGTRHADQISFGENGNPSDGDDSNDFYDWKQDFFPAARKGVFHFVLFAHHYTDTSVWGKGEFFGDDLANFHANLDNAHDVEENWMHELGHNTLGVYLAECSTQSHKFVENPGASHLDYKDYADGEAPGFYDEYDANGGICDGEDQIQDVFGHSTGSGAMSKTADGTTFSDQTWNDLIFWKTNLLDRNGEDGDQIVERESGSTWISAPVSGPDFGD